MEVSTSAGNIKIVHPSELMNLITTERIYQTVVQYSAPVSTPVSLSNPWPTATTYNRHVKTIEHFKDKEDFICNSFVKDLYNRLIPAVAPLSFYESVEDASVECLNNFGLPTHGVLFGPNILIVGEFTKDAITFKEAAPNQGVLVIYMPNKFSVIHLQEKCPGIHVETKYNKYVSNILIMETMKKLELS